MQPDLLGSHSERRASPRAPRPDPGRGTRPRRLPSRARPGFPAWLVLALLLGPAGQAGGSEPPAAPPPCRPPVSSFRIPEKVTFCGEPVPLERLDVQERLEREFYSLLDHEGQLLLYVKRAARTDPVVEPILKQCGLPGDLKFVPVAESGLIFRASSPARAVGYWQFVEATARRYGLRVDRYVDDRRCLERSTRAAAAYLEELHDEFGTWATALAGYNWGEKNVRDAVDAQGTRDYYDLYLPDETERFVFKIITLKLVLESPAAYAIFGPRETLYSPPRTAAVRMDSRRAVPMHVLSSCAGTPSRTLRHLNPWMIRSALPPGVCTFHVPEGKEAGFERCVSARTGGLGKTVHVVKPGESLGRIADAYGVSVRDLERWNNISQERPIHPGQRLVILRGD